MDSFAGGPPSAAREPFVLTAFLAAAERSAGVRRFRCGMRLSAPRRAV